MWDVVITKYTIPPTIPTDANDKLTYEVDKKARYALCALTKDVFSKVVYYKWENDIWKKLETFYQGDEKVKESKLLTLKTQFDNFKMNEDESITSYFLRIDEVVNSRKVLVQKLKKMT